MPMILLTGYEMLNIAADYFCCAFHVSYVDWKGSASGRTVEERNFVPQQTMKG